MNYLIAASLRRPRRVIAAITATPILIAVLLAPPSAASAAAASCAGSTTRSISGTVAGQDHRDINAQVSFDVLDSAGRTIGLNGCRVSGYTKTLWFNMNLTARGWARDAVHPNAWTLANLPANASGVWIEVWTRTNLPKPCPTCDGPVNTSRYGFVNRRNLKPGTHGIRLIAPLACGMSGGTSGNIQGYLRNTKGQRVTVTSIYAWSELTPDGSKPLQGWGAGKQSGGYYKLDNLASGQKYSVWVTAGGQRYKRLHIPVNSCRATPLSIGV